jgi:hypothetical protein
LTLGAAALSGAAGLAVYAALAAHRLGSLLGVIGGAGLLVLAGALALRLPGLLAVAFVLLGGEYAGLFLTGDDAADVRAPLYGALLFVVAELAFAAVELRAGTPEPGIRARRGAALIGLALAGVSLGAGVLAAATIPLAGGVALEAVGVVAAVALLAWLGRLAVHTT